MPTASVSPNLSVTTLPARPSLRPSSTPVPPDTQSQSLPPPQTFDVLAPLHTLLSKLLPASPDAPPSLNPQHLATEAGAIKLRLQKARAVVEALGDMDRGVEEQEEEIRALEEKCEKQREVLRGLVDMKTEQATAMELD
ncbi:hypothetical protein FGG08_003231 [Glutinoglossum americanum]|uniref:Mediator of RNA polymerase II transcription subunit 9 n=1 Tax=Glutinoglossum americanum TaxID=1670608 RepID=A0A9P8L4Y5_9PEZI|nr:hypothetical protein FGG08_003231 [Glutinoglossum americanum]